MNRIDNGLNSSRKSDYKDNKFFTELKRVHLAFKGPPKTMYQISMETGITRPNITRHVAELRKNNRIFKVKTGVCPITRHPRVGFYTTNSGLVPQELTNPAKSF